MSSPPTLHLIGTKIGGGAENFLGRLVTALQEENHPVRVGLRPQSPLHHTLPPSVPVHTVGMRSGIDLLSTLAIRRAVRRHGIAVVQTYMGRATRVTRLRRTGAVHLARLGNYYRLAAYRHCDAWVANTRGIRDYLLDNGFPSDRVFHIGNFVEPVEPTAGEELANLRAQWNLPPEALVVLSAGRVEPVKGFGELIAAFQGLPERIGRLPVHLVLVGNGSLTTELHHLTSQMGGGDRVHWTGWQSDPGPFYDLADLVVFPAREPEPFGNVILEAWAHRRALLVTDFKGAREVVRPDVDAAVVPCGDHGALVRAMRELLDDASRRSMLAAAGAERIAGEFSRSRVVGAYVELYQTLSG